MAFRVNFVEPIEGGVQGSDFDAYYFLPDGVLKVEIAEETYYYSPSYWRWIEPSRGHLPGVRQIAGGDDEWFASGSSSP